jgi:hypothetical protein
MLLPGGRVILFSGHMIDAPDRKAPRFPQSLESAASNALLAKLNETAAGPKDVAISSAACGGDILFAELVLARGVPLRVYLALDEPEFIQRSVAFADADWTDRYHKIVARAAQVIPPDASQSSAESDPFERTNQRMLDDARRMGGSGVILICLWDGAGGDGPGGTKHMIDVVSAAKGDVRWIDIRRLR